MTTEWSLVVFTLVGLLVVVLLGSDSPAPDSEDVVYIVRPRRRGTGCFIVGAFFLGIVATLLLLATLAEHSSG
jgi:hypothetical protein